MKVYVIEKGVYSDAHIVGVCLDKDKAKYIAKVISGESSYSKAYVSEFDTDQFITQKPRWLVSDYTREWRAIYDDYNTYSKYSDNTRIDNHNYVIYADSAEQAIKITQDMQAEYLAEKNGVKV